MRSSESFTSHAGTEETCVLHLSSAGTAVLAAKASLNVQPLSELRSDSCSIVLARDRLARPLSDLKFLCTAARLPFRGLSCVSVSLLANMSVPVSGFESIFVLRSCARALNVHERRKPVVNS